MYSNEYAKYTIIWTNIRQIILLTKYTCNIHKPLENLVWKESKNGTKKRNRKEKNSFNSGHLALTTASKGLQALRLDHSHSYKFLKNNSLPNLHQGFLIPVSDNQAEICAWIT